MRRIFGHIPDYPEGSEFPDRRDLSHAGVHRPLQAGISGSGREGADSIVLSGGYEDDEDHGDVIVYTGHGGRDQDTGQQITHQTLARGNLALAYSMLNGLHVRVIRGATHDSPFSPVIGYRYDGLYMVEDYWHAPGKSGFEIWRFRLRKLEPTPVPERPQQRIAEAPTPYETQSEPERQETRVLRIVRDTEMARQVKVRYDYRCQMCGTRLEGSAGPYAEGAHIRPLGRPHNGPDEVDNIICLCTNHHVLFDHGGVAINDDLTLIGIGGQLEEARWHKINREHLRYHREHYSAFGYINQQES